MTGNLVFLVLFSSILPLAMSSPAESFNENEIVPDVLPSIDGNLAPLTVTYGNDLQVNYGNELTPTQVQHKPSVQWKADSSKLYSLIMTDPDAPSRANPIRREFKHWVVVNIPGDSVEKGHELAGYLGAGPPKDTGLHRYVFLIYEQPGKLSEEENVSSTSVKGRPQWKAANWASEEGLKGPVAGNFFQAKFDDHVPKLHASLHQ